MRYGRYATHCTLDSVCGEWIHSPSGLVLKNCYHQSTKGLSLDPPTSGSNSYHVRSAFCMEKTAVKRLFDSVCLMLSPLDWEHARILKTRFHFGRTNSHANVDIIMVIPSISRICHALNC